LARDPLAHAFVASRISGRVIDVAHNGGELWGWFDKGELLSALFVGPNLVPIELTQTALEGFSEKLRLLGRRSSSIVGPALDVVPLWDSVRDVWDIPRDSRLNQPFMAIEQLVPVVEQRRVRVATAADIDSYFLAAVDMFTTEVGFSPIVSGSSQYRSRVLDTLSRGLGFGWFDESGRTLFKIDVGAVAADVCQIQGVWLTPELRGQGLAAALITESVALIQQEIAPRVSLYVNDFNLPAIAAYRRVGFVKVDTFATIFF